MDKNYKDSTTLIFKNIPNQIENLTTLLNSLNIPAKEIKPFGRKRALITYELKSDTEKALDTLKSVDFGGKTANVSLFCKDKPKENELLVRKVNKCVQTIKKGELQQTDNGSAQTPQNHLTQQQLNKYVQKLYAIEGDLGFHQPPPPYLKYNYPPINKDIMDNICISLLSNKRFYTQVLHLMNRMNLDPPFAERKSKFIPPGVPKEVSTQTDVISTQKQQTVKDEEEEEESELESSGDETTHKNKTLALPLKRKLPSHEDQYKKKARQMLQNIQKFQKETTKKPSTTNLSLHEIFDKPETPINITTKIEFQVKKPPREEPKKTAAPLLLPYDLSKQKLSQEDLQKQPIYKKYQKGEASNKLYIKNLHKNVTLEDLTFLYGRFLPNDSNIKLDVKVMQHGRMKGQAFVTFQGEQMDVIQPIIAQALDETNGFILRDKPMIVCYGKQSQLGLIDTIYVDGGQTQNNNTSTKSSKSKLSQQPYEYVIVVDFEATCWENQAPPQWRESEIIEFPAVLVNLKTGKIEAEFHKYIMPIESPKLSAYCTELTGITQKTVDNGIPLQTALMMFQEWLRKELRARHLTLPKVSKDNKIGNCAFVTWTDWDFGICLNKECSRKRIKKPPYFNQWIDMRAIYREWYKYRPLNFLDALSHVGLHFEGKQHSGIDDAKNLAALTHKIVNDGATLAITKDLTPFQLNLNCVF